MNRLAILIGWVFVGTFVVDVARGVPSPGPTTRPAPAGRSSYPLWDGKETVAEYAARAGIPTTQIDLDLGNKVTMKLALIPAGKFVMGSSESEQREAVKAALPAMPRGEEYFRKWTGAEAPQHEVTISRPFYMGIHEVTQEQYEQVMCINPSRFKGPTNPVEFVSWDDGTRFCEKFSAITGKAVRLPTEAEWEYACRAGTKTPFNTGETISVDQANYNGNYAYGSGAKGEYRHKPVPVGGFKPNAWGLYDMHGNVSEWCSDWFDEKYYGQSPKADPTGPPNGQRRLVRGGSWVSGPAFVRSADRFSSSPDYGFWFGLRVVATAGTE